MTTLTRTAEAGSFARTGAKTVSMMVLTLKLVVQLITTVGPTEITLKILQEDNQTPRITAMNGTTLPVSGPTQDLCLRSAIRTAT